MTTEPHDSELPAAREAILPTEADDWIRQFIKHLEAHFVDATRELPPDAGVSDFGAATARAIVATYLDSGMETEAVVELLGQASVSNRAVGVAWTDAMNERRFELIDKQIQGSLTLADSLELAGLTKSMRDYVDSEANLPMEGARTLHRQLESAGKAE
jgi:hypothetical protein